MEMTVFWVVESCSLVEVEYTLLSDDGGNVGLPLKRRFIPASIHGATSQKKVSSFPETLSILLILMYFKIPK
jgi:hypothetical protein